MAQTAFPEAVTAPTLVAPEFETRKIWERADAIRELARGRMEVSGPLTAANNCQDGCDFQSTKSNWRC